MSEYDHLECDLCGKIISGNNVFFDQDKNVYCSHCFNKIAEENKTENEVE